MFLPMEKYIHSDFKIFIEGKRHVSHIFKLVRASGDLLTKCRKFPSYVVKGSSFLGGYCHGSENRR